MTERVSSSNISVRQSITNRRAEREAARTSDDASIFSVSEGSSGSSRRTSGTDSSDTSIFSRAAIRSNKARRAAEREAQSSEILLTSFNIDSEGCRSRSVIELDENSLSKLMGNDNGRESKARGGFLQNLKKCSKRTIARITSRLQRTLDRNQRRNWFRN